MSKPLIIRDEVFDYPTTGDNNYGEEASNWAEAVTDVLAEITGPGDIPTSEYPLEKVSESGGFVYGIVPKLVFDTSYVQTIDVSGYVKKVYNDLSYKIEHFRMEGVFNISTNQFTLAVSYIGDDTKISLDIDPTGKGIFSYDNEGGIVDQDNVSIKYSAKTKIDESFFE